MLFQILLKSILKALVNYYKFNFNTFICRSLELKRIYLTKYLIIEVKEISTIFYVDCLFVKVEL